jgi:hypothetical protein
MPAAVLLARGGSLGAAYVPNEGAIDTEDAAAAQRIAEQGAQDVPADRRRSIRR